MAPQPKGPARGSDPQPDPVEKQRGGRDGVVPGARRGGRRGRAVRHRSPVRREHRAAQAHRAALPRLGYIAQRRRQAYKRQRFQERVSSIYLFY